MPTPNHDPVNFIQTHSVAGSVVELHGYSTILAPRSLKSDLEIRKQLNLS